MQMLSQSDLLHLPNPPHQLQLLPTKQLHKFNFFLQNVDDIMRQRYACYNVSHMKKSIVALVITIIFIASAQVSLAAKTTPTPLPKAPPAPVESYETANVIRILAQGVKTIQGQKNPYQKVQLYILDGADKGKTITLNYGDAISITQ